VRHRVFIGIGSNLGDRLGNCQAAVAGLGRLPRTRLVRVAPLVETAPQEGVAGGSFLNGVAEVATALTPRELLAHLRALEVALGRPAARAPQSARTMDLDILLFGDLVIQEADLVIPHPRMAERAFVLGPLAAIAPEVRHPVLQLSAGQLLARRGTGTPACPSEVPR